MLSFVLEILQKNPIPTIFMGLLGFSFGLYLTILGYKQWQKARASAKWPSAVGLISESRLIAHTSITSFNGFPTIARSYAPIIEVTYQVNGNVYRSTRIAFGIDKNFREQIVAEAYTVKYATGRMLNVYYNETDPHEAVLEAGNTRFARRNCLVGVFVLLLGLASILSVFVPEPEPSIPTESV